MPQTVPALPEPPDFPASNASYNKIVGKMHKAALAAETASAAIAAVTMCRDAIGGVNTYAKASRRYADELVAALGGDTIVEVPLVKSDGTKVTRKLVKPAADTPAIPLKETPVIIPTDGGPIEVDLAKLAIDPSNAPGGANFGACYSNKSNAKRALKKLGLDHLPVEFEPGPDGTFRPVVTVDSAFGETYANERGIKAKVAA